MAIQITKNYDRFTMLVENRVVDLSDKRTKNLAELMVEHGWLDAYPLMARKEGNKLAVVDGQHRLAIAKEFGIPVKFVVQSEDIDIAKLNSSAKTWSIKDYVRRFANTGNQHYIDLLEFHEKNPIPISVCAAMLSGSISNDTRYKLINGTYQVTNHKQASTIAGYYHYLITLNQLLNSRSTINALWACFHVSYFDPERLKSGAERRSSTVRRMANTAGYLEIFEDMYNFHQRDQKPLKFDAEQAMKARSMSGKTNRKNV